MSRSRRELSNEYLLEKIGFDTAGIETCKIFPLAVYRSLRFMQLFRNHSVVVESEVKKIRADLEVKLANQYGDKIQTLQTQTAKMANDMKR